MFIASTYEDVIDLSMYQNADLLEAVKTQIHCYGITPSQLFCQKKRSKATQIGRRQDYFCGEWAKEQKLNLKVLAATDWVVTGLMQRPGRLLLGVENNGVWLLQGHRDLF